MSRWPDGGRIKPLKGPAEVNVTAEEFGSDWPFSVDRGVLRCYALGVDTGERLGAVTFETNGVEYALNGVAIEWAKRRRWTSIQGEPVWADAEAPFPKKNLGPIIDRGLALIA